MITATINFIETEDAHPFEAPFKVSQKSSKDTLTFQVLVFTEENLPIRAYRVRAKPLNRNSGEALVKMGLVCGSGDVCGPESRSLAIGEALWEIETVVEASRFASEPDGEIQIGIWAMSETEWSS